ncbi:hypothetical protein [Ralstonia phage RSF1]|uniref:Uncharacterized protein n=1 Tax=Ralstonia phage RSF1 TaxID=1689679 RepID=A0A0K2QR65_9CAUD|nr:hypothetical protein AVU11_agp08 [Ralstonia phage RSF1]BAS04811.2 hypothetical protein [Ralstonia phage RSF1]
MRLDYRLYSAFPDLRHGYVAPGYRRRHREALSDCEGDCLALKVVEGAVPGCRHLWICITSGLSHGFYSLWSIIVKEYNENSRWLYVCETFWNPISYTGSNSIGERPKTADAISGSFGRG